MNLRSDTAAEFATLVRDCAARGIDTSDIAGVALPQLRAGLLSQAAACAHVQVLRHRLWTVTR